MLKHCPKCNESKLLDQFYKKRTGLQGYCKVCQQNISKKYFKDNPEKAVKNAGVWAKSNPKKVKDKQLKWNYGISLKEYNNLAEQQNHKCAICDNSSKIALAVDHCHITGVIRGLLCRECNRGLGLFKDSSNNLIKAAKYITSVTPLKFKLTAF